MTRLEQLLAGAKVEWRTLGEVVQIKHGKDYKHLPAGRYPVYGSGGVMTHVDGFVYDKPTVLIPRKGSLQNLFYVDSPFWNVDTIYYTVIDPCHVVPKYLYYYLKNQHLERLNIAGAVPSLTQSALVSIPIPLPSLAVQAEIARILDAFTELEAELEGRMKQYAYYRDQLLSFGEDEVEWKMLGDVCDISRGVRVVRRQLQATGPYPVYQNALTPLGYQDRYNCPAGTVFVIAAGAAGQIGYSEVDFWAADDCFRFHCHEGLIGRFLYYWLLDRQVYLKLRVRRAAVPRLPRLALEEFLIPIPSLARQAEIVRILDRLHALSHSLMDGLPAELRARRKQYEHYRERLLTFPGAPDSLRGGAIA